MQNYFSPRQREKNAKRKINLKYKTGYCVFARYPFKLGIGNAELLIHSLDGRVHKAADNLKPSKFLLKIMHIYAILTVNK